MVDLAACGGPAYVTSTAATASAERAELPATNKGVEMVILTRQHA